MKLFKKGFALVMAMLIVSSVFTVMPLTSSAATNNNVSVSASSTKSGKCGKSSKWKFKDGVLTIYGKGTVTKDKIPYEVTDNTKELIIKDGITKIDEFSSCEKLKKVTIGKGITTLPYYMFSSCSYLNQVKLPNTLKKISESAFSSCELLKTVNIPDSVTYIGQETFNFCSNLRSVKLSKNLTYIGSYAFNNCKNLTKISIPEKVKNIVGNPFENCRKITSFTVNKKNRYYTTVNGVLFNKSKKRLIAYTTGKKNTSYTVPKSVNIIETNAFMGSGYIKTIKMSNSVQKIKDSAFAECERLSKINLSQNLNYVGFDILYNTKYFKSYENRQANGLYNGNVLINVANWEAKNFTVKKGTKIICSGAFSSARNLKKVTIPEGVKYINGKAFCRCELLKQVTVPKSVKVIGNYAFGYYYDFDYDDPNEFEYMTKTKNFKMKVYKNSAGYKYAKKNKFTYQIIK